MSPYHNEKLRYKNEPEFKAMRQTAAREGMRKLRKDKTRIAIPKTRLGCTHCNYRWYSNPLTWIEHKGHKQPKRCPNCGETDYIRIAKIVKEKVEDQQSGIQNSA